jgi:tryptophan synthase alpha chain
MAEPENNRLIAAFTELRSAGKKTVLPFITAGYPDLETTAALLKDFESRGVRVVELGIPFSDPIADGPTIQASYTDALGRGVTSQQVFDMVSRYRHTDGRLALVAMDSYSIVFRYGPQEYLQSARQAGFDGLIIPDLPLEEAAALGPLAEACGLANVMLIAPTTPPARQLEIARHSRGFIYFISVAGITGERERLPETTIQAVAELRQHTSTPICVGFGIAKPEMVAHVCEVADGAIVGSAIVHRIIDHKDEPPSQLGESVGQFVGQLLAPVK